MHRIARWAWIAALLSAGAGSAQEQKSAFRNDSATICVGLDDQVYVSGGTQFLRCKRDGSDAIAAPPGPALSNVTANAGGIIAAACAHFAKNVTLFDGQFNVLGRFS